MKNYDKELEAIVKSLALPPNAEDVMLESIYDNLKSRVGMRIARELSDEDLAKLEPIIGSEDAEKVFEEISKYVPNFDQIMDEEIEGIKADIATSN